MEKEDRGNDRQAPSSSAEAISNKMLVCPSSTRGLGNLGPHKVPTTNACTLPEFLPLGPPAPHQIIINSPSPDGTPMMGRKKGAQFGGAQRSIPTELTIVPPEDQRSHPPVSPMDAGPSSWSPVGKFVSKTWLYREQKQRGSSSDFTDTESEVSKDFLLSPGLMMSPAPFSPFGDGSEPLDPRIIQGMVRSISAADGGGSTCRGSPRSRNQSTTSSPIISGTGRAHRFQFSFDPSSPTFKGSKYSTSYFLLPPGGQDESRERSSSDSEAIAAQRYHHSAGNLHCDSPDSTSVSAIRGEGRGRPRYPTSVKKRFLERFMIDQAQSSDQSSVRSSNSSCSSLATGLQGSLSFTEADGDQIPGGLSSMGEGFLPGTRNQFKLRARRIGVNRTGSHNSSVESLESPVMGHIPLRLSSSSVEIGGLRHRFPYDVSARISKIRSASSENTAGDQGPFETFSSLRSLTNTAPGVETPVSLSSSGLFVEVDSRPQSPSVRISPRNISLEPSSHAGLKQTLSASASPDQTYFNWWLQHQAVMSSDLLARGMPQSQSVANPLFSTASESMTDVLQLPVAYPEDLKLPHRTHLLGPSRYPGTPYEKFKPLRSRSESDVAYVCFCGQSFALRDRLAKHIACRHRDRSAIPAGPSARSHTCSVCSRVFTRSDMLTRHMRLHTGVRPYGCTVCGQVFSRSDHLSTHQRTHTGEKPYGCPQCSYTATRRDMITRHMKTHAKVNGKPVSMEGNNLPATSNSVIVRKSLGHRPAAGTLSLDATALGTVGMCRPLSPLLGSFIPPDKRVLDVRDSDSQTYGQKTIWPLRPDPFYDKGTNLPLIESPHPEVSAEYNLHQNPVSLTLPVVPGGQNEVSATDAPFTPNQEVDAIRPRDRQQSLQEVGHSDSCSAFAPAGTAPSNTVHENKQTANTGIASLLAMRAESLTTTAGTAITTAETTLPVTNAAKPHHSSRDRSVSLAIAIPIFYENS